MGEIKFIRQIEKKKRTINMTEQKPNVCLFQKILFKILITKTAIDSGYQALEIRKCIINILVDLNLNLFEGEKRTKQAMRKTITKRSPKIAVKVKQLKRDGHK